MFIITNSRYKQEVSKFSKKDAIIAICLFLYWAIYAFIEGMLRPIFGMSEEIYDITRIVFAVVNISIVFAIVLMRKQGLRSIGLHKNRLGSAVFLGLMFAPIAIIIRGILPGLIDDGVLSPLGSLVFIFVNTALLAVREDITFVGFIQTRIHGLVKNDNWAINIVAAMFAVLHIPQQLVIGIPMGVVPLILWLVICFFIHRAFVILFKRYFSLVPVFIMHTFINFSNRIWQGQGWIAFLFFGIFTVVFVVAVEVWDERWNKKRADKVSE